MERVKNETYNIASNQGIPEITREDDNNETYNIASNQGIPDMTGADDNCEY